MVARHKRKPYVTRPDVVVKFANFLPWHHSSIAVKPIYFNKHLISESKYPIVTCIFQLAVIVYGLSGKRGGVGEGNGGERGGGGSNILRADTDTLICHSYVRYLMSTEFLLLV